MSTKEIKKSAPGSTFFEEPEKLISTEAGRLSEYISELKYNQKTWATQDLVKIENLLTKTIETMAAVRTEWLAASTRNKGDEENPVLMSEELLIYGATGGYLNDLLKSISEIRKTGKPPVLKKNISWGNRLVKE